MKKNYRSSFIIAIFLHLSLFTLLLMEFSKRENYKLNNMNDAPIVQARAVSNIPTEIPETQNTPPTPQPTVVQKSIAIPTPKDLAPPQPPPPKIPSIEQKLLQHNNIPVTPKPVVAKVITQKPVKITQTIKDNSPINTAENSSLQLQLQEEKKQALAKVAQNELLKREQQQQEKLAAEKLVAEKKIREEKLQADKLQAEKLREEKLHEEKMHQEKLHAQQIIKQKQAALLAKQQKAEFSQEQKLLQQQLLNEQLSSEKQSLSQAESQQAQMQSQGIIDQFKAQIIQAIQQHWIVPDNTNPDLSCVLLIHIAPGGAVMSVDLAKSSGDSVLDRSAITAVMKASPLPVPKDSALFEQFRSLRLTVHPQANS